jgi:serine/threonine protein kinase
MSGYPIEFIYSLLEVKDIVFEDYMQNEKWKIGKFINQGRQGGIYLTSNDGKEYVIKVQVANNNFFQEVRALQDLQDTNYVVKIFDTWTYKGSGYIVMEKVNPFGYGNSYGIDDCTLWKEVGKILNVISKYGWLQVDVHKENVAITNEGKIILIDFGYAVKKTKDGNETYPEHKLSINFPNITWDQLKINQDFTYQKCFNPYASDNTECKQDKQKIFQESKEKWESQKFDQPLKGRHRFVPD